MKRSWIIILALAMLLVVFTVACGEDGAAPSDISDSRQLDFDEDDGDVETARSSNPTREYNFDIEKLEELLVLSESDEASFRGTARDMSDWASAAG